MMINTAITCKEQQPADNLFSLLNKQYFPDEHSVDIKYLQ